MEKRKKKAELIVKQMEITQNSEEIQSKPAESKQRESELFLKRVTEKTELAEKMGMSVEKRKKKAELIRKQAEITQNPAEIPRNPAES
ncbi:hypothetical protein [Neobacillus cucumis]|uniref:hypothetical protein n=1 Tax=Neobacillus cucumis TaxID=1740721 RepID=UPI002852F7AA|nr:hypothetical protein [Neobacillus cucumis]MDR4949464.1 hypothetical protein [Neobacillus cucumis]